MRMPKGIKSMQSAPLKETESVQSAPPRKTESVHSVPLYNTKSHQPLYSKEIFMQKVNKNWEGFNN